MELQYYDSLWQQVNKRQSLHFNLVDEDILMHVYVDGAHLSKKRAWGKCQQVSTFKFYSVLSISSSFIITSLTFP